MLRRRLYGLWRAARKAVACPQITSELRIRRGERTAALIVAVVAAILNGLLIYKYWDKFTLGGNLGYYSIFYKTFAVSGFDAWTLIDLSCEDIYFNTLRHPLLFTLLYPLYAVNHLQMLLTQFNCAALLMAAVQVACAVYSFVFLMRIIRSCTGLRRYESAVLTGLYFSFAYILLTVMVPDHFGLSQPLLLLTVLVASRCMHRGEAMKPLTEALLLLLTAGITVTNGVKTVLAALFVSPRKTLGIKSLAALLLPSLLLVGVWQYQKYAYEEPQHERIEHMMELKRQKNAASVAPDKKHDDWRARQNGTPIDSHNAVLKWSDTSTPRLRSVVENMFGESVMLHTGHLLGDVQQDRPVFVPYDTPLGYVVAGAMMLLLVGGLTAGLLSARHRRLTLMLTAWLAFDMTMHLGFGFGLNEVYIMTAHWALVIPISAAILVATMRGRVRQTAVFAIQVAACFLFIYNVWLIGRYCLMG